MQRCHQMESKHPCCNRCLAGAVSTTRSEIAIQRKAKGFGYTNCISLGSRLIKTIKCSQLFEINFERVWIKKVGNKKKKKTEREKHDFFFFFYFLVLFLLFFSLEYEERAGKKGGRFPSRPIHITEKSTAQGSRAVLQCSTVGSEQSSGHAGLVLGSCRAGRGCVGSSGGSSGFPPLSIPVCPHGPS